MNFESYFSIDIDKNLVLSVYPDATVFKYRSQRKPIYYLNSTKNRPFLVKECGKILGVSRQSADMTWHWAAERIRTETMEILEK